MMRERESEVRVVTRSHTYTIRDMLLVVCNYLNVEHKQLDAFLMESLSKP
jgi:hypothetical protein